MKFNNRPEWHLDENGIDVETDGNARVVDLRNECKVEGVVAQNDALVITLVKDQDYTKSEFVKVGDEIILSATGSGEFLSSSLSYPTVFEGIYDITHVSANICVGDICILVKDDQKTSFTIEVLQGA